MNKLYSILSFSAGEGNENINVQIRLNRDHPVFEGHFPGHPILPGVCTVQIVKELLEKATASELMLHKAGNIKYLGFVNPEVTPEVQFNLVIRKNESGISCAATVMAGESMVCSFKGEYSDLSF